MCNLSSQNWIGITAIATCVAAIATICYMFITRRILLNTNRQYKYTTLLDYLLEIKEDYEKIAMYRPDPNGRGLLPHTGYDALKYIFIRSSDWSSLQSKLQENSATSQNLLYVIAELTRLVDKLIILDNNDKYLLTGMIIDFYNLRMKEFIDKIIEYTKNQPQEGNAIIPICLELYNRMGQIDSKPIRD